MYFTSLITILTSTLLLTANASPLDRRQTCVVSSCAVLSGTQISFVEQTGGSCAPITPPPAIAQATATPTDHPESCFYPKSMGYCDMGQSSLMSVMSSVATAVYNAQTSGAVLCGATKTANLPYVTPASSVSVEPAAEITVTGQA